MNCAEWQEKIALFTGADLPADEAVAVEAHLSACEECRSFERELSEARARLLSMRTVDDADVSAVRSKVLDELYGRSRRSPFAWMPYAAAVAVLVVGWAIWRTPATNPAYRAATIGSGLAASITAPSASGGVVAAVAKRKPRVRPRSKPQPKPDAEPTIVTLFTDDPDVLIVWITD